MTKRQSRLFGLKSYIENLKNRGDYTEPVLIELAHEYMMKNFQSSYVSRRDYVETLHAMGVFT